MQGLRLVPLTRASDPFHARVLAARLGAEGIVTHLRGVEVLVELAGLDAAREVLLVDEVESAFEEPDEPSPLGRRRYVPWVAGGLAVAMIATEVASVLRRL